MYTRDGEVLLDSAFLLGFQNPNECLVIWSAAGGINRRKNSVAPSAQLHDIRQWRYGNVRFLNLVLKDLAQKCANVRSCLGCGGVAFGISVCSLFCFIGVRTVIIIVIVWLIRVVVRRVPFAPASTRLPRARLIRLRIS